eukprot:TRINITY_DN17104_c0_g1_i2.p1 TRINITY_DN17104_c0_g1~~TRINITY_DN17104_c0_g1_i2.p1  ORF type:complete len:538 (+),score=99.96 TRINITY_DN17104_c0_g1_i2:36-1616(+)
MEGAVEVREQTNAQLQEHEEDGFVIIPYSLSQRLRGVSLALHDLLLCTALALLLLGMSATTAWWAAERVTPWMLALLQLLLRVGSWLTSLWHWQVGKFLLALLCSLLVFLLSWRLFLQSRGLVQSACSKCRRQSFTFHHACCLLEAFSASREQQLKTFAIVASLQLTALPVIDIYSAVALFAPPQEPRLLGLGGSSCRCWEVLHGPTFYIFGLRYIASAITTVLRAESHGGQGWWLAVLQDVTSFCEAAGRWAQVALSCMALLYALVISAWAAGLLEPRSLCAVAGWPSEHCTASIGPLSSRGLVLGLHALSMSCSAALRLVAVQKRDDLLRILLTASNRWGARLLRLLLWRVPSEQSSAVIEKFEEEMHIVTHVSRSRRRMNRWADVAISFNRWWPSVLKAAPVLREAAPSAEVVKFLVAVQHFSPLLALTAALVSQAQAWPLKAVFANYLLGALIWMYYACGLGPTIPERKLERLVLLVPSFYVNPSTRAMLGHALHIAKNIQKYLRMPYQLLQAPVKLLRYRA